MNALTQIAERREPQKLYLMRNDFGLYKVGISHDPESRRAQIENSSGVLTNIVEIFEAADAFRLEQKIHAALKDIRRTGEWFAFADDDEALEQVRRLIATIPLTELKQSDPTEVAIKYRMSIQDVKDALYAEGIVIQSQAEKGDRRMVVVVEGQTHYGRAAATLALAFAHSGLVKAGFFKPDKQVLKHYLEAISLLTPVAEFVRQPFDQGLTAQIAQAASNGVFDGVQDQIASDVLTAIGLPSHTRRMQIACSKALRHLGWQSRILRGRTVYRCPHSNKDVGENRQTANLWNHSSRCIGVAHV